MKNSIWFILFVALFATKSFAAGDTSYSFTKEWSKFYPDNISWFSRGWVPSIETVGDYLLVHTNIDFDGQPIEVYDRFTGNLLNTIPVPATVTRQICADEAGHFVVTRFNNYGAGFVVYYYEDINSDPVEILNWPDGQCPVNLGFKTSVAGNLKTGKAYIYTTVGIAYSSQNQAMNTNTNIYQWELNDGVPVSIEPVAIPSGVPMWNWCSVQRKTTDADSDIFSTFHIYLPDQGSRIAVSSATGEPTLMNSENHKYRIFDQKVFNIGSDEFLAISQQGYDDHDPISLKVFETTDRNNFNLTPDAGNYANFALMQSEDFPIWNVTREGDVAVAVNGDEAYIYLLITSSDFTGAGLVAYKMAKQTTDIALPRINDDVVATEYYNLQGTGISRTKCQSGIIIKKQTLKSGHIITTKEIIK